MKSLLLLLALGSPGIVPGAMPVGADPAGASSVEGRTARAASLLAAGAEGRSRLAVEAREGPASGRRAALLALATLPEADLPDGTLAAGLEGLASPDALLREAAGRALAACGERAAKVLEKMAAGTPAEGFPAVPPRAAADALSDLRRRDIEREFLATWSEDDGTFDGMFNDLRRHGPFGARVLVAVALDRRVAGSAVLGFGPYAWLAEGAGTRDRFEVRSRALEALCDCGDALAREMLRPFMREVPASELFDDGDENPIPAHFDDRLRMTIAALGDPFPLREMIEASDTPRHGVWTETVEMRRRASAFSVLGHAAVDPAIRTGYFDKTQQLLLKAIRKKREAGIPVDGVEYYNLACALARRDKKSDRATAIAYLETSVATYAVESGWIERDGDLASLRGEPKFQELVRKLKEREKKLTEGPNPGGK